MSIYCRVLFFFFTDPASTEIYTLSLHDALPIWLLGSRVRRLFRQIAGRDTRHARPARSRRPLGAHRHDRARCLRSEEHTSELQSRRDLVCRLLLEKKKKKTN